jgi:hypothetical protein
MHLRPLARSALRLSQGDYSPNSCASYGERISQGVIGRQAINGIASSSHENSRSRNNGDGRAALP